MNTEWEPDAKNAKRKYCVDDTSAKQFSSPLARSKIVDGVLKVNPEPTEVRWSAKATNRPVGMAQTHWGGGSNKRGGFEP